MPDKIPKPRSLRALVVEDQPMQREHAAAVLQRAGATAVLQAEDGDEALALLCDAEASEVSVDVVVCDLNMPHMDGLEFLRHLSERQSGVAIILISALDERILQAAESLARARELNLLGALEKPLRVARVRELLEGAAPQGKSPRAARRPDAKELSAAIRGGLTGIHFQPLVTTAGRHTCGFEALARWYHPALGYVSPSWFVPLAEETGLAHELTESVIRNGVAQSARWRRAGLAHRISFNLSVAVLNDVALPDWIERIALDEGVPPRKIVLEVTESRGVSNLADALEILTRLRIKGFELSIDDFGTGNSTMEQLRRFPFTELKIDQSYVTGARRRPNVLAMLEATIRMARNLELRVIAEGVETQEDWDLVTDLGCDEVQGYLLARPMPASALEEWMLRTPV